MDEEVVIDLFNRAQSKGYTKSIEDFKLLLETDEDVIVDNFNYVKSKGYAKPIEDFKVLVKKKDETTELVSPQEEVVTTSVTEEVETPGVSDVSVSEEVVETTPEPTVDTPEISKELQHVIESKTEDKSFNEAIATVVIDDIDKDEEILVPELLEKFNKYGFSFQESSWLGDAITVYDYDGNPLEVDLQTFTSAGKQEEYNKLIQFLNNNRRDPKKIQEDLDVEAEDFKYLADREDKDTESSLLFPQVKTSKAGQITTGPLSVISSLLGGGQEKEDAFVVAERANKYITAGGEKYKQQNFDRLFEQNVKALDIGDDGKPSAAAVNQAAYDAKIQQRINAQEDFINTLSPERKALAEALTAVREAQRAGASKEDINGLKQKFNDLYNIDAKKLYNFDGTYIEEGNAPDEVVAFNNQVEEGAIEKHESYTPEELEDLQVDLLYKTIFSAKKINTHKDKIYEDLGTWVEAPFQALKKDVESLIDGEYYKFGKNLGTASIATDEIRKVAETGRITETLPLLPGNSPLVQEYNNNVKQLLEVQGALALNYNPSTLEEEGYFSPLKALAVSAYETATGQDVRVADDMVKAYVSAREDAGLKVTDKDKQRAEDSILDEGMSAVGSIIPLIGEIALTKKAINLTGALKNMQILTRGAQIKSKSPYTRFAIGLVSSGAQEALVFKSTGVLSEQLVSGSGEGMTGTTGAGFGLGQYGGNFLTKALLGTRSPLLQGILTPIQKSRVLRGVFNGTANATVGTGSLYGAEFFDTMVNTDKGFLESVNEVLDVGGTWEMKDGKPTYTGGSPIKKLLVSFSTMGTLGLGNAKGWKNMYDAMRSDIKNYKAMEPSEYSKAVETLGLDPKKQYTAEEIKKAYRAKSKEVNPRTKEEIASAKENGPFKITKEKEINLAKEKLTKNYEKLTNDHDMLLAQEQIKKEEGYKKKKREMFFMANRMKNNVEFTGKEYELDYKDAEVIKDLSIGELEVLTEDLKKQGISGQDAFTLQGKVQTARNHLKTINDVGITEPGARKRVYDLLNKFTEADRKLEELKTKAKTSKANEALFSEKIKQQEAEVKGITDNLQKEITKTEKDAVQEQTTEEGVLRLEGKEPTEQVGLQEVGQPQQEVTTEVKEEVVDTKAILNKSIEVSDEAGRKGLVPFQELEKFVGEDRLGDAEMTTSRETIDELKEDIKKNGFKEPIIVTYDPITKEASILEGNHRMAAAKELGLKEIPVTFEKGTIRTDESRAKDKMFPLNRVQVGELNTRFGVKGGDLGLTVRQPNTNDFIQPSTEVAEEVDKQIEEIDKKLNEKVTKTVEVSGNSRVSESDYDFYSSPILIGTKRKKDNSILMFKQTGENTAEFEFIPSIIEPSLQDSYSNIDPFAETTKDSEISTYQLQNNLVSDRKNLDIEIVKPGKVRKNADGEYEVVEKAQIRITRNAPGTSFKNRTTKSKQTKTVEELKYQGEERKKLEEQKKAILSKKQTVEKTEVTEEVSKQEMEDMDRVISGDTDVQFRKKPNEGDLVDASKVRARYRPGKRISKGVAVKGTKNNKTITETEDLSVSFVKNESPQVFIKNANILAKEDIVRSKKKFGEIKTEAEAQEVYDIFVREVADNLIFLTEEFNQDYKDISTLWYDGANILAQNLSKNYDVSVEQVAGIIASLSPQKDWYQNVRLAELTLITYKDNPAMTQDMVDFQQKVSDTGLDGPTGARRRYKKSRTNKNKEALRKKLSQVQKVQDALTSLIGTKIKDADPAYQAYYVRLYTELNVTKDYNILRPDGEVMQVATKKDGTKSKVAWGSYTEIGKTVSIYNDGSQNNITATLGQMHKIRNFYNNIIDPMSKDGDVTIDTHAVAAGLLKPLSGNSREVGNNFGTGTSNSGAKGIKGVYYAYSDAYALAAEELGLLPRQVQSITWEAVRGLYTDSFKRDSKKVKLINDIWERYREGKITINEARNEAIEKGEGINDPTWAKSVYKGDTKSVEDIRRRSGRADGDTIGRDKGRGVGKEGTEISQGISLTMGLTDITLRGQTISQRLGEREKLIGFLGQAFPATTWFTDPVTWERVLSSDGVKQYVKNGEIVYGMTRGGDIYLNPKFRDLNTPIHEVGHILLDYYEVNHPELFKKGMKLVEGTKELKEAIAELGDNVKARKEALATLIGNEGETLSGDKKKRFKEWLLQLWKALKAKFPSLRKLTLKEISNLTLEDFIGGSLKDIFSGRAITRDKVRSTERKDIDIHFRKGDNIYDIVRRLRNAGFETGKIKVALKSKGYDRKEILKAVEVPVDILRNLPESFGDIKGGVNEGIKLYESVLKEMKKPSNKKLPIEQNLDKGIEFLKKQEAFIAEGDAYKVKGEDKIKREMSTQQKQMIVDFERSVGMKSSGRLRAEVSNLKKAIRERKAGERDIKKIQSELRLFMRKTLPTTEYKKSEVTSLISKINKANKDNIDLLMDEVFDLVDKVEERNKVNLISKMYTSVKASAKSGRTISGRVTAKGRDAEGRSFFKAAAVILKAAKNNDIDAMLEISSKLADKEVEINEAIDKEFRQEPLTTKERILLDQVVAFDTFANIMEMSYDEVLDLDNGLKDVKKESIRRLKENRLKEAENREKINKEADNSIFDNYSSIVYDVSKTDFIPLKGISNEKLRESLIKEYESTPKNDIEYKIETTIKRGDKEYKISKEDGKYKITVGGPKLMTQNELSQKNRQRHDLIKKLKIFKYAKEVAKNWDANPVRMALGMLNNSLSHLGTMSESLDKTGSFFYDNVYERLNIAQEKALAGFYKNKDLVDDLANKIPGVKKKFKKQGLEGLQRKLGIKTTEITLSNNSKALITPAEMMRVYALSLNEVQKNKLVKAGYDDKVVANIKTKLGKDVIDFVDQVVNYLSNNYYEQVNKVYVKMNNVDLPAVENYFPTVTESQYYQSDIVTGDFSKVFSSQYASALKERTDVKGDIVITDGRVDFFNALTSHFKNMEKFKSYAQPVKDINTIFNNKSVTNTLKSLGADKLMRQNILFAINPDAGKKLLPSNTEKLQARFTRFVLNFKLIQIPKQASSFIHAFEQHEAISGRNTPGLDHLSFAVGAAELILRLPKNIKLAKEISGTFRDRLESANITQLESGLNISVPIAKTKLSKAWRKAGAFGTRAGDILGVVGYMINYNRDIRNNVPKDKALIRFNDYNKTQQTRRGTEMAPIQQNPNFLMRVATMFQSTMILQYNRFFSSANNFMRSAKKGKYNTKAARGMMLNLGLANTLFSIAANLFKLAYGNDEDKEEIFYDLKKAGLGVKMLGAIPLLGSFIENFIDVEIGGKNPWGRQGGVNPYTAIYSKFRKEGPVSTDALKTLIGVILGTSVDPFIGLYNYFKDDQDNIKDVEDIMGVTKSYQASKNSTEGAKLQELLGKPKKTNVIKDAELEDVELEDVEYEDVELEDVEYED